LLHKLKENMLTIQSPHKHNASVISFLAMLLMFHFGCVSPRDNSSQLLQWAAENHTEAARLYTDGKYPEAEALLRKAIAVRNEQLGPRHQLTLQSRSKLALVLKAEHKLPEAQAEYRDLLKIYERTLGFDHAETILTRNRLAGVLYEDRRFSEAEAQYRIVLKQRLRIVGPYHWDTLQSRNNLAGVLRLEGKLSEAQAEEQRAEKDGKEIKFGTTPQR